MSNFVVSARKYRPNRFDDVVGQEHVSQTLKNAFQNDKLAHAFLFCGPRGVGKTTCARILAKVLNCQNITKDYEACNECDSCKAFNENASFNITELDAASNNSVEHIRSLLEQVRFQPQQGKYKVFIIDEVHMLSQQAFNAFLKTLEEPPPYAIFILATTEKHKIIPTILSRCQIFDFRRIQVPAMVQHLEGICQQEEIEAEKEALHIIAQKADGALRDALSIFDRIASSSGKSIKYEDVIQNLNVLDYDYFFNIVDAFLMEDLKTVMLSYGKILRMGFEPDIFVNGLAEHFRNLLVSKDEETLQLLEASDTLRSRYQEQATNAPTSFLLSALSIANDCDVNFKMARNKRLHAEMAIIKMCYIKRATHLHYQSPTTSPVPEKKTADLRPTPSAPKANSPQKEDKPNIPVSEDLTIASAKPARPVGGYDEAQMPSMPAREQDESKEYSKPQDAPVAKEQKEEPSPSTEQSTKTSKTPNALPINKLKTSSKFSNFKLAKLDELDEAVMKNEIADSGEKVDLLTDELLKQAWDEYVATVNSNSVKAMLSQADKSINAAKKKLTVTVGTQMAKGMLQQESDLMPHLRTQLKTQNLALEIIIDTSKSMASNEPKKPKALTAREKYEKLTEINPLLKEMRQRFDLKLDKE